MATTTKEEREKRYRRAEQLISLGSLFGGFKRSMKDEFGISARTCHRDWCRAHARLQEHMNDPATQEELAREAIVRLTELKKIALLRMPADVKTAVDCDVRVMRLRGLVVVDEVTQSQITITEARDYVRRMCDHIVEIVQDKETVEALLDAINADAAGGKV